VEGSRDGAAAMRAMSDATDPDRMRRNVAALAETGLEALVCALPANVLMISGYWPIIGTSIAIITPEGRVGLVVPEDEKKLAERGWAQQTASFEPGSLKEIYPIEQAVIPKLREVAAALGIRAGKIGFEQRAWHEPASYVAMNLYGAKMAEIIPQAISGATPIGGDDLLVKLRSILTPGEIDRVRRACALAAQVFANASGSLHVGVEETSAAACLSQPLFSAERAGGHVAVMSGIRSSYAFGSFARSTQNTLRRGQLALVHCNSTIGGFWTDITRTFLLGESDQRRRQMYEAVFASRQAALQAIRPGARAADVDRAARSVMQSHGFGDHFKHPTGHGVGFAAIDHNAPPVFHPRSDDILQPGMVFNIEPAIYVEGQDGMRHCDMVAVTESGAELLTPFLQETNDLVLIR
jgi:Xaa-Pro aminopeptidase